MTDAATNPLLELRGVTKTYPGVIANSDVALTVYPGEIHAVLGENGAGKSTLMKIIYGATTPDSGEVRWRGEHVSIRSPAYARSLGIGMVFQHFSLFETLTVAQNISLAVRGTIEQLSADIRAVADDFGMEVNPDTLVHSLSVGERQRVEIIRCILQKPKLLIMDEPTSVLPPQGVTRLFKTLRQLAADGCAILYISHKLREIRELCDSATILRQGKVSGMTTPRDETEQSLAEMMIGRDIPRPTHPAAREDGDVRLDVVGLNHIPQDPFGTRLSEVALSVRAGEIIGIAGVSGNGQNELLRMISGEEQLGSRDSGSVHICGQSVSGVAPNERRQLGLSFVPEERLGRGAVPALSLSYNGLLTGFEHGMKRWNLLKFPAIREFADRCIKDNDVRCSGIEASASSLSGGNLQKFIIGRELALAPKLLVLSQPTWGIDVGAAAAIRQRLINLRDEGIGILIVSEELEELFEVADKLHVIYAGQLSEAVSARSTTAEQIGHWMTGAFTSTSRASTSPSASSSSGVASDV
jgi:general nucleoside transport system ATP-binding protein